MDDMCIVSGLFLDKGYVPGNKAVMKSKQNFNQNITSRMEINLRYSRMILCQFSPEFNPVISGSLDGYVCNTDLQTDFI